jgi:translation initiation factor 2B subunit (eIF-2B alpha/beta/delta family)
LLSFTIAKKNSTKFIKDKDLDAVLLMQKKYKRLKEICQELPLAYLQLIKDEGVPGAVSFAKIMGQILDSEKTLSEQRLLYRISELEKNLSQWREKAIERTQANNTLKSRIKQLEKSRDSWKERAQKAEQVEQKASHAVPKKTQRKK